MQREVPRRGKLALRVLRHERKIDDLRAIVQVLADSLTEEGIRQWLRARIDACAANDRSICSRRASVNRIQDAAEAFDQGYLL